MGLGFETAMQGLVFRWLGVQPSIVLSTMGSQPAVLLRLFMTSTTYMVQVL